MPSVSINVPVVLAGCPRIVLVFYYEISGIVNDPHDAALEIRKMGVHYSVELHLHRHTGGKGCGERRQRRDFRLQKRRGNRARAVKQTIWRNSEFREIVQDN